MANIQWDPDNWDWGLPDIKATVSDVREETPKIPYQPLEADYEDFKYVVEYHEYLFDIQVRTKADVVLHAGGFPTNEWWHETSMPYCWKEWLGVTGGSNYGTNFDGGCYVRFSCLPWGIPNFGPVPEGYSFNGYWLGIMNAKVEGFDDGVCQTDTPISHTGWVRNVESVGSQLNMFMDDGTFSSAYIDIPWDITKVLDPDVENAVVVYLPFDLMAGAYEEYTAWSGTGSIVECKPVDYYLTYTVRIEGLVIREYEYRDPSTPPNPSPIEPPHDYVPYTPQGIWDKYWMWIILGVVLVFAFFFGTTLLAGAGLSSILRGRKR